MTATAIPIRAPDGSRTETWGWCAPRPGVLRPEDGPGLGAAWDGREVGPADREGWAVGSAGREGRGDGPGVRPPPGALVPGRSGCGVPGFGAGACPVAG